VEVRLKDVVDGGRESGSPEAFIRPSGAKVGGWNKRGRWGRFLREGVDPLVATNTSNAPAVTRTSCPDSSQSYVAEQLAGLEKWPWQAWEKSLKEEEIFQRGKN
jgi:hypothetical protein